MIATIQESSANSSSNQSIVANIGNTPLIQISHPDINEPSVTIFAKAEWLNPGGSVKDRAALGIIMDGLQTGELAKDKTLLDASSGNTAIAYSMICASMGIKVKMVLPENASLQRRKILRSYGAELILTDPLEGIDGSIEVAREVYNENQDDYFYANQYDNPANWLAHYNFTGQEILEQSHHRISHFIAGLGTSGTFTGISKRLKNWSNKIQTGSFQPDLPFHGMEGLKHMKSAIRPQIYDETLNDFEFTVSTEAAYRETKYLAKNQGLFVGVSSGAALNVALQLAGTLSEALIITIFPDRGDRYLSEKFW